MDVTGAMSETIRVEDVNGVTFEQRVTYDWIPPFCDKCKKVGHNC